DSEVARRLRAGGAVILAKGNLSQWAGRRTKTENFNGSTVGGTPHNPYELSHSPAGSSSGPAIAAAASLAAAGVGSDTTGSIIGPSSMNGIVGMRPTYAHKTDYTKGLKTDALKGVKIGVMRGYGGYNEKTQPVFDAALEVMKQQGAELVEVPDMLASIGDEGSRTEDFNFKVSLNAYLAQTPPSVKTRTMADLIEFNKTEEHEKLLAQDCFISAEATTEGLQNPEYIEKREDVVRKTRTEGL